MKAIRWLALVWFVAGLFGFVGLGASVLLGSGEVFFPSLAAAVIAMTFAAVLDGFATIVGYFERASKKQGK